MHSLGKYLRAWEKIRFNFVFFLQLSLVHKDKVSKDCESYSDSYTYYRNSTEFEKNEYLYIFDNNTFCSVILYIYRSEKTRCRCSTFCKIRHQFKLEVGVTRAGPAPAKAVSLTTSECSFESMQQANPV